MAYTLDNTAARRIRNILVVVDGANTDPERAFKCADEYIERLEKKKALWSRGKMPIFLLGYIFFVKYTNEPRLMLYAGIELDPRALEPYFSKRISDEITPRVLGVLQENGL